MTKCNIYKKKFEVILNILSTISVIENNFNMNLIVYLSFSMGLITAISASDWKPIIGTGPSLKTIQQPIIFDSVIKTASSSKSSITFNGQTISTSIGDIGSNDAAGPVLTVDAPDLTTDIEEEPRYLGYGGKILNGFFAPPTVAVSH